MPFLRLYSRDVPLDEKRLIAQKLISITLHAFHLRPEQRNNITIQFIPRHTSRTINLPAGTCAQASDVVVEIADHNLTVEKITAFIEAATPMLSHSAAVKPRSRVARLLGIGSDESRQVAFQFSQIHSSPMETVGDSVATLPARKAA